MTCPHEDTGTICLCWAKQGWAVSVMGLCVWWNVGCVITELSLLECLLFPLGGEK